MLVRVIYRDQTAGVVESHLLEGLVKKGRIVAFHSEDRWISTEKETSASRSALQTSRAFYGDSDRCTNS